MLTNKRNLLILAAVVAAVVLIAIVWNKSSTTDEKSHKIKKGKLEATINCKGEVKGEKYTEINIPDVLCNQELRVYQVKILDVINEGKSVKKGDYVAKLDESQYSTMMRDNMMQKEKVDADLRNAVLDSTIVLSSKREALTNAKMDLEYLKIDLEQSIYESEAYQRKTRVGYQKAENEVSRLKRDYLLEKNRLKLQVSRAETRVADYQTKIKKYMKALAATSITAPEDGIVMFAKDWNGKTYGKDSQLNIWNTLVATLPDMSVAINETYIREIDIAKVQLGDSVRITIDALADKEFKGKVVKIATIGETHKDFDMKVFKVVVRFDMTDKDMKPGMTANNNIITASFADKLLVPLKAVFTKDGKQVVFLKKTGGAVEQEIKLLGQNDEFGAVDEGLTEGDVVLLYQPEKYKSVAAVTSNN